jgi:hypothetical protein
VPRRAGVYKNGEIHVNILGQPEGKPITPGHLDFKPSWSKTGDHLVASSPPNLGRGYYLMTPNPGGEPKFDRIGCELANTGILDRISVSPDETKMCFDYQPGKKNEMPGRTLYIADFDVKARTISNARPFANAERKKVWFDYPRWNKDGSAIFLDR